MTPILSVELRETDDGTWIAEHDDGTTIERATRADALAALDAALDEACPDAGDGANDQ